MGNIDDKITSQEYTGKNLEHIEHTDKNPGYIDKIVNFYNSIRNLPYTEEDRDKFNTLSSRVKRRNVWEKFYVYIRTTDENSEHFFGSCGRMKMWHDKILSEYHKLNLEGEVEKEHLNVKIYNGFFRNRLKMKDKFNTIKLGIWSPYLSTLWTFIPGNKIKAKLKRIRKSIS